MGCSGSKQGVKPGSRGWDLSADVLPVYPAGEQRWVSDKRSRRAIVYSAKGPGSKEECPPMTFSALFKEAATKKKDKLAFMIEPPEKVELKDGVPPPALPANEWKSWTWGQYYSDCFNIAKGMLALGVEHFDGAPIYGMNSPYWVMSQMACVLAGVLPAGIYPTDTQAQIVYKTLYADSAIAFCGEKKCYETYAKMIDETTKLKAIVCWGAAPGVDDLKRKDGSVVRVFTWEQLLDLGKKEADAALEARLAKQDPSECVGYCFTSGTTGKPKAVMISSDNVTYQARATIGTIAGFGLSAEEGERSLSYLPLSHVAGLIVDIVIPMACTAVMPGYSTVYFARAYDLKAGSLGARLQFVKPTSFLGVPRVWEKIAEKMRAKGAQTKGLKKKLVTAAKSKGLAYQQNLQIGGSGMMPAHYDFFNKKVLSKIKEALGLEFCKIAISGAAPLSKDLQEYFGALGISINDSYGMSECCGATTVNSNEKHQWGTVGNCLPGSEVRVFQVDDKDVNVKSEASRAKDFFRPTEAEQGELCYRGRHIMMGYYANPALGEAHVAEINKKNAETIDNDGYLHSGDKGTWSDLGFYRVTGRYKELIIGAGGENIAPVPVEDAIKKLAPGVANVIMIGDQRKFNTALVTLRAVGATGELPGTDELDPSVLRYGSEGTTKISQAVKDPKWIEHVTNAIKAVNEDSEVCVSNVWRIQRFTILPRDFSITTEELTPTLKTKRGFVDAKYKSQIDNMYKDEGASAMYVECPVSVSDVKLE